ncbi:MAG: folate-binding protein YgfZ [Planctomycetota bacterium]
MSDVAAQQRAFREGAAVWERRGWQLRRWSGEKRLDFLHKYCTQEVRRPAGEGAYGCVLTVKGGTVGDLWALVRQDDLLVLCAPAAAEGLYAHLGRYARFDRVVMDDLSAEWRVLSVSGPRSGVVVAAATGASLPAGQLQHAALGEGVLVRDDWLGAEGYDLIVAAAEAGGRLAALLAAGATEAADEALAAARIEAGVPLYGVDMDEGTIPVEAGLEERAIAYDKGCYTGQEVIVRIKHRGKVNRHLRGLLLPEGELPATPLPLFSGEKEVGPLTSAARSARLGRPVGLAILHRKYEPGTTLALGAPDGPPAEIAALPLA